MCSLKRCKKMSLWKELLLWTALSSLYTVASRPVLSEIPRLSLSLCNLMSAEKDYVRLMFGDDPPKAYKNNSLEPVEGVVLTAGNSTVIRASMCALSDYLCRHLHPIIRNITERSQELIANTSAFQRQFKNVVKATHGTAMLNECHRNISASGNYELKVLGLQIIYSTRRWVECFLNDPVTCYFQLPKL